MHRSIEQALFSHTLIIIVPSTEASQTAAANVFLALTAFDTTALEVAQSLPAFSLLAAIWVVCVRTPTCGTLNLEKNDSKCLCKAIISS